MMMERIGLRSDTPTDYDAATVAIVSGLAETFDRAMRRAGREIVTIALAL